MRSVRRGDLVGRADVTLAALLRTVGVPHGHWHDGDGVVDAGQWRRAGDAPPRADDHLASDLLAQAVGRADVVATRASLSRP